MGMGDSFFPAARKVLQNPFVKWTNRALFTAIAAIVTTIVWPAVDQWVDTRADSKSVTKIDQRVQQLESARLVNHERLYRIGSDLSGLTDAEKLQWAIERINRLEQRLVVETRARLMVDVAIMFRQPKSEAAQRAIALAKVHYNEMVSAGIDPETAAQSAIDYIRSTQPR